MHSWNFGIFLCITWSSPRQRLPLLFIIVINFLTSKLMQELLLSLLFADDVGLASERVAKLQEVFDKRKNILEDHGLRVSESKTKYMYLPFSDPQAPSPDIMINGNVMPKCNSFVAR